MIVKGACIFHQAWRTDNNSFSLSLSLSLSLSRFKWRDFADKSLNTNQSISFSLFSSCSSMRSQSRWRNLMERQNISLSLSVFLSLSYYIHICSSTLSQSKSRGSHWTSDQFQVFISFVWIWQSQFLILRHRQLLIPGIFTPLILYLCICWIFSFRTIFTEYKEAFSPEIKLIKNIFSMHKSYYSNRLIKLQIINVIYEFSETMSESEEQQLQVV